MGDQASTSRAVIRAAIVEWDRTTSKGQGPGEFCYLLSERERDQLAECIERALGRACITTQSGRE